ncbi:NAD(+) synthase [Halocola ammonii]
MKKREVIDHIVDWLKNYLQQSGAKGFIVGVSGGIDSALTSTLCALTGAETKCVEMPIHQHQDQVSRAFEHIGWLKGRFENVKSVNVELTDVFDRFVDAMPEVENESDREMSLVNSRARLRMTALYYFAGLEGKLVAGTGNKVEDFGVGFYTKYGDGGVDLSPIADLTKTEVYGLAEELGIIEEILSAKPTDGLWGDDRTDEDQIGASYPELEWAMKFQEEGRDPSKLDGREKEVYEIYDRLHKANLHKMNPIPVCEVPKELK